MGIELTTWQFRALDASFELRYPTDMESKISNLKGPQSCYILVKLLPSDVNGLWALGWWPHNLRVTLHREIPL